MSSFCRGPYGPAGRRGCLPAVRRHAPGSTGPHLPDRPARAQREAGCGNRRSGAG
jgi:hypothetical protein